VYIDNLFVGSFTTEKDETVKNVFVNRSALHQFIEVSWQGTTKPVEVVLKKNGAVYASKQSSGNKARFDGVLPNQEYAVYINNTFIQTVKLGFRDTENHWAKDPIERLVQHNIITGFPDGTFKPEQTVTREEFIKLLVQAKRYQLANGYSTFKDVPQGRWSEPYISAAIKNGIIDPKAYGSYFAPAQAISREEMAVYIARALNLAPDTNVLTFTDNNKIQQKNRGLVGAVVKAKIINGYPDRTFRPNGSLTRAEAAQVLNQVFLP
jgi:hypothetical protein